MAAEHQPVLLQEVLQAMAVHSDGRYVDATYGRGGHAAAVVARLGDGGRLLAIDRDPDAAAAGRARFAGDVRVAVEQRPFSELAQAVAARGWSGRVNGIVLDLGVSSPQLDEPARGFSFRHDGPLDMRMDPAAGVSAARWLEEASEGEIDRVVREYGEERFHRRVARAIVAARGEEPITRTGRLADVVAAAVPTREPGKHPATRVFQALRIVVNRELEELEAALPQCVEALGPGGRLCVISFHSLEDRLVKRFMRREANPDPVWAGLPDIPPHARPRLARPARAVRPSPAECDANPRARSAVLRTAERLP